MELTLTDLLGRVFGWGRVQPAELKAIQNYFEMNRASLKYIFVKTNTNQGNPQSMFAIYEVGWSEYRQPTFEEIGYKAFWLRAKALGLKVGALRPPVPSRGTGYPMTKLITEKAPDSKSVQGPSGSVASDTVGNDQGMPAGVTGKCWDLFEPSGAVKEQIKNILETTWIQNIKPQWFANPKQDPVQLIKTICGNNIWKRELLFLCSTCKKMLFSSDPKWDTYGYPKEKPRTTNLPFMSNIPEMQAFHRFLKKLNDRIKEIASKGNNGTNTWKDWSKEKGDIKAPVVGPNVSVNSTPVINSDIASSTPGPKITKTPGG